MISDLRLVQNAFSQISQQESREKGEQLLAEVEEHIVSATKLLKSTPMTTVVTTSNKEDACSGKTSHPPKAKTPAPQ